MHNYYLAIPGHFHAVSNGTTLILFHYLFQIRVEGAFVQIYVGVGAGKDLV